MNKKLVASLWATFWSLVALGVVVLIFVYPHGAGLIVLIWVAVFVWWWLYTAIYNSL